VSKTYEYGVKMEALWQRLRRWAADCPLGITLRPGASEADIAAVETALGMAFPADLREYLRLANGEKWNSDGLIGGWRLLELKFVVQEAQTMRDLAAEGAFGDNTNGETPAIKGLWWNPRWLPIVASGSGHFFCVDLDPNHAGTVGQVILFLHDDTARYLVAHSLKEWFARLADDMERGLYEIVTGEDGYRRFNSEALLWSSLEGRTLYQPLPENG